MTLTTKLLRELIALPSVNNALLPPKHPDAGEKRVADFLAATAAKAGLDIEFQKVFPGRANILARLTPTGKVRQRILLAPHMDTVGAMTQDQFNPHETNGRLYGRGACDTKGSVAAMLTAVCELAGSRRRPSSTEIVFAGLVDEEIGQGGSRALAASGFRADLAIVGEPTRLRVVTAHKGNIWLGIETRGRAAHGSRPELGENAVLAMARIVELLETKYAAQLRRRRHPLLGHPTVNVGTINGGVQTNIVPDRCRITVDRRTIPGESNASIRKELKRLLGGKGWSYAEAQGREAPCLPMETSAKLPLVRAFLRSAGQPRPAGVNFFCDASVLSHGGTPSVVFGPGDIAQGHTRDEWISLASLERGRRMLVQFLASLP
jgi:acetylornithine deacetylase/succinyl-diaminopimelate desuccinylase-like protein